MQTAFSKAFLPFLALAFHSLAAETAAANGNLPCELGYQALYDLKRDEVGIDRTLHGFLYKDATEYVLGPGADFAYIFTQPLHAAYPAIAAIRLQRNASSTLRIETRIAGGCSYGDKAAYEKFLYEIETKPERFMFPPPWGAATRF